jgi:hypothetical protein
MFENWWWYRVDQFDNREFAFNSSTGTVAAGNTATTTWAFPFFNATLEYVVTDLGVESGAVTETLTVTSTATSGPIVLNLFSYLDYDLAASAGGDSATLLGPGSMQITDTTWVGMYDGPNSFAYQVDTFANVRTLLNNANADNLNNTGLPFGPGDFTAAYQWNPTLTLGQTMQIQTRMTVTNVPEPATGVALALGGLAILALRRRRR